MPADIEDSRLPLCSAWHLATCLIIPPHLPQPPTRPTPPTLVWTCYLVNTSSTCPNLSAPHNCFCFHHLHPPFLTLPTAATLSPPGNIVFESVCWASYHSIPGPRLAKAPHFSEKHQDFFKLAQILYEYDTLASGYDLIIKTV
jgi:hypothetical protein